MKTKYLLDTNILINHQRGVFNLPEYMCSRGIMISDCFISEITWIELMIGEKILQHRGSKNRIKSEEVLKQFKMLTISDCIKFFVEEKCRLQFAGTPLENNFDLLIGCTGVVNNLVVVTDNTKDFKNIKGIKLENWK